MRSSHKDKKISATALNVLKNVSKEAVLDGVTFSEDEETDNAIKSHIKFWLRNNIQKPVEDVLKHMLGEITIVELREKYPCQK